MSDQKALSTLEKGDSIDHYLLLKKREIRLTKAGKEYLLLELGDKSLTINANVWEGFENFYESIRPGDVLKVTGTMDDFQGTPQIRINNIRLLKSNEKISPSDFLPVSRRDPGVMKGEFVSRVDNISDHYLRTLMKRVFDGENLRKFSVAPAGKSWHHSYLHGLIEHTLEIIRICDLMCDIHPEINRDLLVCGAMMHDFGKTEELSFDVSFDYTDKGKLLGHIVISAMIIEEEAKKIDGFPEELKNCLIHLILSHQGKLEYASPVVPKTLEAITLYQADELSAKVNAYKNALALGTAGEGKWTKFITLASTDLYNHGIRTEGDDQINKSLFD